MNTEGTQKAKEMAVMTRRERRARRQRRFVTVREAQLAARLARMGYKVSNESGALRVPSKMRTWYQGNRKSAHQPPPGQAWERSGPAYVTAANGTGLAEPIVLHRWRRLTAESTTNDTTE